MVSVTRYSLVGVPNPVRNFVSLIFTVGAVAEAVICLVVGFKFGVIVPEADTA